MTNCAPESTASNNSHLQINIEDEERRLMAKGNTECKDDFWIGLSQTMTSSGKQPTMLKQLATVKQSSFKLPDSSSKGVPFIVNTSPSDTHPST
jgi:hypothetical protein